VPVQRSSDGCPPQPDVLEHGRDRPRRTTAALGARWQPLLSALVLGVIAAAALLDVLTGRPAAEHAAPPPAPADQRAVGLGPLPFASVLTLESPGEPGTPLGAEVATSAVDLAVRGECSGSGVLTVSFNTRAWLRVSCAAGRVSSAERHVTAHDLFVARRGPSGHPFLVAQSGDSSADTHWRVTVREIAGQVSGGRTVT
jgi:hypothetical protein